MPLPQDVTILGNSVFKEVIKIKEVFSMGLIQHDRRPYKKIRFGQRCTEGRPCEDSEKVAVDKPMREASENQPCWHLDLRHPPTRTVRQYNSAAQVIPSVVLFYDSPNKWIQYKPSRHSVWVGRSELEQCTMGGQSPRQQWSCWGGAHPSSLMGPKTPYSFCSLKLCSLPLKKIFIAELWPPETFTLLP